MPITDYLPTNTWPAASAKGDFLFTIYRLAVAIILAWQSEPEMMASPLHDIARHSPPFTKMWAQLEPLRMLATLTLRLAIFIRINGGLELLSSSKDCTAISQRIRGISSSPRPTPSPTSLIAISHISVEGHAQVERHRNVPGLDMVSPDPGGRRRLRILRLRGLRSVAVFADAESTGLLGSPKRQVKNCCPNPAVNTPPQACLRGFNGVALFLIFDSLRAIGYSIVHPATVFGSFKHRRLAPSLMQVVPSQVVPSELMDTCILGFPALDIAPVRSLRVSGDGE
ncbi:hypothetical protein SISNIDRAFT_471840 [Sistotremastrum niveocremeum HHB9708]|uniref:Uncharacterized protein n=1 Tax=Sistotremastrum niveocremeum HHB9708 TaxID=1314777 RepID=A0A164M581_9AGAM|nr:hypothetical protein SISNIDRAFT_471840 [Sistotremastrum niveocremeum HHB9708]